MIILWLVKEAEHPPYVHPIRKRRVRRGSREVKYFQGKRFYSRNFMNKK